MDTEPYLEPADQLTLMEELIRIEQMEENKPPPLIMDIKEASYDEENQTASVKLSGAWQKANTIRDYDGAEIILKYNGIEIDPDTCPKLIVSLDQIERDISIFTNSVRLNVSGISEQAAEAIEETQCFALDTQLVKDVIQGTEHKMPEP